MNCYTCGAELELRHHVHEEDVGGVVVRDGSTMMPICVNCGEVAISANAKNMYELRAAALVLRDGRRVNGDVLRYARKALGLRQTDLARILEVGAEWISRWETGGAMATRSHQLAIVALLDDAWMRLYGGQELRQAPPADSNEPIEAPALPEKMQRCA